MASWKSKSSIPIDKQAQETIKKKHRLHDRWIRAKPDEKEYARMAYVRARNQTKTLLRKAKRNFEKDVSDDAKTNPKKFWSYVRGKMKTRAGIAPLLRSVNDPTTLCFSDKEKASILQKQFCSVFVMNRMVTCRYRL